MEICCNSVLPETGFTYMVQIFFPLFHTRFTARLPNFYSIGSAQCG